MAEQGRAGVRLVKQTTLYTLGIAATRFANLILLPLYLRTLSKEDYGALGVLEQLVQMLVILTMAGGMETLVKIGTDLRDEPEQQLRLVSTMTTWMVLSGLGFAALGALVWPWTGNLLGGIPLWPLGLCSLTTVAGFGSLMGVRNPGVKSMGELSAAGIAFTLIATIVVLAPLLRLRMRDPPPR